jgi:hypothetical protein
MAAGMLFLRSIRASWSLVLLWVSRLTLDAVVGQISRHAGAVAEHPEADALEFSLVRGCGVLGGLGSLGGGLPSDLYRENLAPG